MPFSHRNSVSAIVGEVSASAVSEASGAIRVRRMMVLRVALRPGRVMMTVSAMGRPIQEGASVVLSLPTVQERDGYEQKYCYAE